MSVPPGSNPKTQKSIKIVQSLKPIFGEIWRMTPGKVAIVLLVFLIAMSIVAVTIIPADFITKWESPTYWEDNPVVAPPCWVSSFGYKVPATLQAYTSEPNQVLFEGNALTAEQAFNYNLDVDKLPQDIYIKVNAPLLCYKNQYGEEVRVTPELRVVVERPDGIVFEAWHVTLRYAENITCGSLLTYKTGRESFNLASLINEMLTKYNITVPEDIIGYNKSHTSTVSAILRTTIRSELENRYMTTLSVFVTPDRVSVTLRSTEQNSTLSSFKTTLSELLAALKSDNVDTFSRRVVLENLNNAVNNITVLLSSIQLATYSDFVDDLTNARNSLDQAIKWSMDPDARVPGDLRTRMQDVREKLNKYIETITSTTELIYPVVTFKPLQGDYKVTVNLVYSGLPTKPEQVNMRIGFIVKGGCYGILGTAAKGIDIASVILYGTPIALLIGLVAAVASVMIGVLAGIVSGYYGGLVDEAIQRTVDILSNIPFLPLMIIIGSIAQKSFTGEAKSLYIILLYLVILIIFSWGGLAITVRAMTLSIKEEPYVEAARALGASNTRIIFRHIFPQVMMYATAALVFRVPDAILTEAGLSVLGLRHGWPTWGSLLADARAEYRYDIWWWIIPPGLMLSLTSLTFVLLGLAIERIVEPRLRTL
jgi:peptide/nickel transport system permease protein